MKKSDTNVSKISYLLLIILFSVFFSQKLFSQPSSWKPAYNENGYPTPCSVTQGETVNLHISTTYTPYTVKVYKLGVSEKLVATYNNIEGGHRGLPERPWETGCRWPVSLSINTEGWESGAYAARFPLETGPGQSTLLFFVKEKNPGTHSDVLVVIPFFNWVAYNTYGGKNVYPENSTNGQMGARVSFNRPLFSGGYAEFRAYPYKMIKWLEANSIRYEVATEMDVHKYPDLLGHYNIVIQPGHAEYWSRDQRRNVENYINNGGKYLSLSGNTCWWQIRIEDNDSTLVCYKYPQTDPLYGKVDSLMTVNWFDKPLNLPENLFLGASFRQAGYVDDINHKDFTHAQGYGGFSAHNTQHWLFKNTGLKDGQTFGRDPKDSLASVVGYETDGALFRWDNGLPKPLGSDGTPKNFRILGISPCVGQGDTIEGRHTTMGLYTNKKGGAVFNSSSIYWVYGLPKDSIVQRITMNILQRFWSNSFPPDITGWSPYKLVTDTANFEVIQINKREVDTAWVGKEMQFSLKAEDPYGEKVKYLWYVDKKLMSTDSVFKFTPAKADTGKKIITAYAYNSKDSSSISWDVKVYPDTATSAVEPANTIVYKYDLEQNYPNPFNPTTNIKYSLAKESNVKVTIYNTIGQIISVLVDKAEKAGKYSVLWETNGRISSGIYFYSVEARSLDGKQNFRAAKKMILLK
ncbi:MAG: T9SS type A sorting domain-containing protein [Ignavibacteria bacterium]|nr:T9SS type A sorting domain-containing protein [Ignavibacteria bacterium]MCU7500989.1 T9SS type A sorting domain-containing protein [Ignavibacteria bacterium]MCU7519524.1 T9SS type A sorting domain-containing protein [Ignavibacteria bacterium]MCU7526267.1 T9SS type A sorting domain-containing protein [Ignavibacteria bacterium]